MIQKIRENVGTIVICAAIVIGVPAVVSNASPSTSSPTPSQSTVVDVPVFQNHSGGTEGASEGNSGAGGSLSED